MIRITWKKLVLVSTITINLLGIASFFLPNFFQTNSALFVARKEQLYRDVNRASSGALYMAYYFPQFHVCPENKIQTLTDEDHYTEWDVLKNSPRSLTPPVYYNLTDHRVLDAQDELAYKHGIGAFIFYHFWLDNTLVLNLPVDLYILKKRKTKFLFFWDNESGFLGQQLYDSPEKHAYQLSRFFLNENYLTDINGRKPFIVYHAQTAEANLLEIMQYLSKVVEHLELQGIRVKLGHSYQKHRDNWYIPEWGEITSEFAPHFEGGVVRTNLYSYIPRPVHETIGRNQKEYWQGAITSWDSRARCNSLRTKQSGCSSAEPNGMVSPQGFGELLNEIFNKWHPLNIDKIITIFAWNEWTEGAALEETVEYGFSFIEKLH